MKTIAHFADTHIKNLHHHDEMKKVFSEINKSLIENKPDIIVHVGDVVDNKTSISPELISMVVEFFSMLLSHNVPVIIVPGNHDGLVHNPGRMIALKPIVEVMANDRLIILDKTTTHYIDKFAFHALSIFEHQDTWDKLQFARGNDYINIGMYHGTVGHVKTDSNYHMDGEVDLEKFERFDYLMLGHIHLQQHVDTAGRAWYCGSTMQCSHDESVNKGYLLWKINDKKSFTVDKVLFANPKPFQTIQIQDYNEIIDNFDHFAILPNARLKIIVNDPNFTLTQEDDVKKFIKGRVDYSSIQFLKGAGAKRQDVEDTVKAIELNKLEVQQSLIIEHLTTVLDIKDDKLIKDILDTNAKLFSEEDQEEYVLRRNTSFKIKTIGWSNLFSYGHDNEISFDDFATNSIIGIFGENFSGKSSIIDVMCFVLWNKITKDIQKNVEMMHHGCKDSDGFIVFEHGNRQYRIERSLHKSKSGAVKSELQFFAIGEENKLEDKKKNTDKEIITYVGDVDDFLMTSFMSQFSGMMFVNEKSAARRDILKRILNLGVFDKRIEKLNKELYYLDTKRRTEYQEGLDEEVTKMRQQVEAFDVELESKRGIYKEVEKQVLEYQKFDNLVQTEKERLSDMSNVEFSKVDVSTISKNYFDKKRESGLCCAVPVEPRWCKRYNGLNDLLKIIESLKDEVSNFENSRRRICDSIKELEKTISGYEAKNVDEGIPCLEIQDDMVGRCSLAEYYVASKNTTQVKKNELDEMRLKLEEFDASGPDLVFTKERINVLGLRVVAWKNFQSKLEKYNKDLIISQTKSEVVARVATEYKLAVRKNKKFDQTVEQREKYEKLNSENTLNLKKLQDAKRQRDEITREGQVLRDRKSAMIERLKVLLEKEEQFQKDLYRATVVRTLHRVFAGNSGLAISIMKKFIPLINSQSNEILSQMSEIVLKLEATEKDTLELTFTNGGGDERSVGTSSGAERTMISIALRMALAAITSLPVSNLFILDEPATAFDEKRLTDFERVLNVVKSRFEYVILITHIDALKEFVDTVMLVEKNDDVSKLIIGR